MAVALEQAGSRDKALEIVQMALAASAAIDAKYSLAKGFAESRAAQALVSIKALPLALATARQIEDAALRTQSLWIVATAQANSGDTAAAETTFLLADAAALDVKSDLDRAWILSTIAASSARRGDHALARRASLRHGILRSELKAPGRAQTSLPNWRIR